MRTKRRRKVKKLSWYDEYKEKEARLATKLFELKYDLKRKGYTVKITNEWGTYIITPKIDSKFLRIMKDNEFTIEPHPWGNMAQNILLLQDMRKEQINRPRDKDFNVSLAIKLVDRHWNDRSSIRYTDRWYKGKEIDEDD